MAKPLNFNNLKKQFLTVTLSDDKATTLLVGTPTKSIMTELICLQESIESMTEDNNTEAMDLLYGACARIMSRNKNGIKIEKEFLEEIFDFEDVIVFIRAYMDFVQEIGASKN